MKDPLWTVEERFWTGGSDIAAALDPGCLMAFPQVGILEGRQTILESLRDVSRWSEIRMTDRVLVRPKEGLAVLAYRANAKRSGDESPYNAVCTSTYIAMDGGWRMIQHQQAPG